LKTVAGQSSVKGGPVHLVSRKKGSKRGLHSGTAKGRHPDRNYENEDSLRREKRTTVLMKQTTAPIFSLLKKGNAQLNLRWLDV